jgi:hypothetical protein
MTRPKRRMRKGGLCSPKGCVELAFLDGSIAVRDPKNRSGPTLLILPHEWKAFAAGARNDEFHFLCQSASSCPWRTRSLPCCMIF